MSQKILITGGNGMLGTTLTKIFTQAGYEVHPTDVDNLDITNQDAIRKVLDTEKPDILINCAAYTNVEQAEEEKDLCYLINATAAGYLAEETARNGVKFIHISTDHVFSQNTPDGYTEDDDPGDDQQFEYAKSKRAGEKLVLEKNPDSYIARISWTFGPGGKNFVDTMLMLAETKDELSIVTDEVGVPTYTLDAGENILKILRDPQQYQPGVYHCVNEGFCSRFEEAKAVFEIAEKNIKLNESTLKEFGRRAQVPNYSILKNTKLPKQRNWRDAMESYIKSK